MDELSRYDYHLPKELIANYPLERRDASRLMVLNRTTREVSHHSIRELPDLLEPGDCLVLNDSRVVPAQLVGVRSATGGKWQGLFAGTTASGAWRLMARTRGKMQVGEQITVHPTHGCDSDTQLTLTLTERDCDGLWTAVPDDGRDVLAVLDEFGTVPLPPYISRRTPTQTDWERYQTSFAEKPGSIAAPTAGLHFTNELFHACQKKGIHHTFVTLHVGLGTFLPITSERLDQHQIYSEWCEVRQETVELVNHTRQRGGRIIAVGTTAVRTLETAAIDGILGTWRNETSMFIRPEYRFQCVDGLLTNFHLPRSTLFLLACAFVGTEFLKGAYQEAITKRYRFYSYGDATLIL